MDCRVAIKEFAESLNIEVKESLGFATTFIDEGLQPLLLPGDHSLVSPVMAARILAYDLITVNGDRTIDNPNLLLLDGEPLCFDFEHCLLTSRNPSDEEFERWYTREFMETFQSHVLFRLRNNHELENQCRRVIRGSMDPWLGTMIAALPVEWERGGNLVSHFIQYVQRNSTQIVRVISEI